MITKKDSYAWIKTSCIFKSGKNIEENSKIWVLNDGQLLKDALENIFQEIIVSTEKILKDPSHLPED